MKKAESTRKYVIKQKLKFEDYRHCLESTQPAKNQLEKKKFDVNNLRENHKKFIKPIK